MNSGTHASVMGNRKNKAVVETVAQIVFTICAFFAVLAVVSITLYMINSGTPAIMKVGLGEILFGTEWMPTAADPDRKSTRLNSSHDRQSRMPSSA